MKFLTLILLLFHITLFSTAQNPYVIITTLYNETNNARTSEYVTCLEYNLSHKLINVVHVMYDTSKDDTENKLLRYLKTCPVIISYIDKRPTYADAFALANTMYPNRTIILANADIFFDETLQYLETVDLNKKFIALSRWEDEGHNKKLHTIQGTNSQDVWIFKTPFSFDAKPSQIVMGTYGCDGMIACWAHLQGFHVINPLYSITAHHVHSSQVRNWKTPESFPWNETMRVPWCALPPAGK